MAFILQLFFIGGLFFLWGCQSYPPQRSWAIQESLQNVEKKRTSVPKNDESATQISQEPWNFNFINATQLLQKNNPKLKEAYQEYKKAYQVASLQTPFPNPEIEIGAIIGSNLDEDENKSPIQPQVAFDFILPLSNRLKAQDRIDIILAQYAYLNYLLLCREEYLHLRKQYIQLLLWQERDGLQKKILDSIEKSSDFVQKLVVAGTSTALDVGIMELELLQKQEETTDIQIQIEKIQGRLAELLGVQQKFLIFKSLPTCPELPKTLPDREVLKEKLITNHPTLLKLRLSYEISNKKLDLEMAKQIPDLTLSPFFEGDPGTDKALWGISLRIPLPFFDQNQKGIMDKKEEREFIQVQYETMLSRLLSLLETSMQQFSKKKEKLTFLEKNIFEQTQKNVALSLESLKRGETDFLKYLEAERSYQEIQIKLHQAKIDLYEEWFHLEEILGSAIFTLPEEESQLIPILPTREEDIPLIQPNIQEK